MANLSEIDQIEAGLQRLMPRGLSDESQQGLEEVIDGLAAQSRLTIGQRGRRLLTPQFGPAMAAVLLLSVTVWGVFSFQASQEGTARGPSLAFLDARESESGAISVLESRVWLNGGEDLGIRAVDDYGDAQRGWSYVGVEEERVLHEDSGYEVILQREFEGEHYAYTSF